MLNAIKSEWTKMTTIRSYYITLGVIILAALAPIWFIADTYEELPVLAGSYLYAFYGSIGAIAVVIISGLMVTGEYRYNEITNTFLTIPKRWKPMVAKTIVASMVSMALCLVIHYAGAAIFALRGIDMSFFFDGESTKIIALTVVGTIPLVMVTQALGWLTRSTAIANTIMIVMVLGIDNLLGLIPKVGEFIHPYLLMNNLKIVWSNGSVGSLMEEPNMSKAMMIVLVWLIVAVTAAVVTVYERDA